MKNLVFLLLIFFPTNFALAEKSHQLFMQYCAGCHGSDRLGISAPPLVPQSFGRKTTKKTIIEKISDGVPSTQMAGFKTVLKPRQIEDLARYVLSPIKDVSWGLTKIAASHKKVSPLNPKSLLPKNTDPLNLFTVVEIADHHISFFDGDHLRVLKRLPTKRGVHGGAKYSPDGRYMYLSSREGWVEMFDMHRLEKLAEVRVGINTRNIAVSSDGRVVVAGNLLPKTLVVLNAKTLKPVKVLNTGSRVAGVYNAPPRKSFILALKDVAEIWELSYGLKVRKIALKEKLINFSFDPKYTKVMGTAHNNTQGQVVDLDKSKKIATLDIKGMPHLGSGITFQHKNRSVLAAPNMKAGLLSVVDTKSWKIIKNIQTKGPGFFLRSHKNTEFAWADVFWGAHKDVIHIISKKTLNIVKTLKPAPGKTAAHVEFDRHGKYALVSVWENDGALVVYNAQNFKEVKRIPMKKPSGKYNVFNKISYAEGTSH